MEINQVLTTIGKSIDLDLIEEHSETFKIFIAETAGTDERYARLHSLRGVIENKRGEGALALLGLMEHEPHPSLVRNLSFFASELIEVAGEQPLGGPRLVIDFIMSRNPYSGWKGSAIAGMVQLGDKRVNQMLLEAWSALEDEDKRIASEPEGSKGFVLEGVLDFYISSLEQGCDDSLFGSTVGTLCRIPSQEEKVFVFDVERTFPTYIADGSPIWHKDTYPKSQLLMKFRERLEKLEEEETEPKLIPMIYQFWS
jgi:hypothetical protein